MNAEATGWLQRLFPTDQGGYTSSTERAKVCYWPDVSWQGVADESWLLFWGGGNSLHSTFHLSNLFFIHLKIQWLERNHGGLVQMGFPFPCRGEFLRFHDVPATNFPGKKQIQQKKKNTILKLKIHPWKLQKHLHNLQLLSNFLVPCYC